MGPFFMDNLKSYEAILIRREGRDGSSDVWWEKTKLASISRGRGDEKGERERNNPIEEGCGQG